MSSPTTARAPDFASEPCPLCGGRGLERRFAKSGFFIVRCERCGVELAWPLPGGAEVESIYADPGYFSGAEYYLDYVAHEANHRRLARRVLARLGPSGRAPRLLDVGAAAGFFLDEARKVGWSAVGIEPSPSMSAFARDELGLDVRNGRFDAVELGDERFDLVTFLDSFEHFPDPARVLERAASLLAPRGRVALLTPNAGSPLARVLGRRWPHYTPPEHVFFYAERSLFRLLELHGFEPVAVHRMGHDWSVEELVRKLAPRALSRALPRNSRWLRRSLYLDVGDLFVIAKLVRSEEA
ncbi:MAG: class I SAM-dependent methyltransferase [Polyangiaceae bacterium]